MAADKALVPVSEGPVMPPGESPATPAERAWSPPSRRVGIKAQLILWWSALVVLVLAGTGLMIYQQRREFLEEQLKEKGRFVVRSLARMLVNPLLEGNYSQMRIFVSEQADADLVDYACLQDMDGTNLAEAGVVSMQTQEAETYGRIALRRTGYEPIFDQATYLGGRRFLEYSTRLAAPGMKAQGVIRVGFDTERRIDRVVEQGIQQLMLVFLAAIPLGVGLSVLLAYWIARPMRTLVEGAEAMAAGNFERGVVVESPREMAVLAASFDHMRVRIKDQIRELEGAYHRLDRKVYELEVLVEAAKRMNFKSYSPELLAYLLDTAIEALDAEWGSLMMVDERSDPEELTLRVVRGAGFDRDTAARIRKGEGIAGQVFETGVARIANQGSKDPLFIHKTGQDEFEKQIRSLICVPLMIENQPIGVFNLVNSRAETGFDQNDLTLLTALASQAARSLENAKLYDQAIRESKTGLFVPRYFEARVREEIVASRRYGQFFSLVVLDIDHFKKINDTYGHLMGDEVLVKLARFVIGMLREDLDVASRFGGEEFALLLPKTDSPGAAHVAERLRQKVEAEIADAAAGIPKVTISVGISTWPRDAEDQTDLFEVADAALYAAKENGRNQVRAGRDKRRI